MGCLLCLMVNFFQIFHIKLVLMGVVIYELLYDVETVIGILAFISRMNTSDCLKHAKIIIFQFLLSLSSLIFKLS